MAAGIKSFNKHNQCFMYALSKLENKVTPSSSLLEYFNNDEEIALAVMIQNCMHPKNSNRSDAVKKGTYVEIENLDCAR